MSDRLLVIDDDGAMGELIRRIASGCGYAVSTTTEADDFLARLDTEAPSHVMVDLQVPSLDGIELLRELARRNFTGPVFILSGMDSRVVNAARRFGMESGLSIVAALTKPFRANVLAEALQAARRQEEPVTEREIEDGLARGEFGLVYQPKVFMADGALAGFEALARWRRGTRDIWPPSRFLSIIEQGTLADRFSESITRMAARQQKSWASDGLKAVVAVNLSAANLWDIALPDRLLAIAREEGVDPAMMQFEITETAAMQDDRRAMDILTRLRIKGFGLAIDDFGTGFSSLSRLQKMPIDEMKIDRSFVVNSSHDPDAQVIVRAVASLGHALGMRVTAEGIETPEAYRAMAELGCDIGQGFHIGLPMDAAGCSAWVVARANGAAAWRLDGS